ncbi:MAG: hypothetical protein A3K83_03725 [Omnitrophica WOR_2 bacterium RBG_13_44_8b]|nr:MAG: hypothetical protein A3K83_03725 [Omnitrophica WOR_2 bacterium RBG_13_44_8b]
MNKKAGNNGFSSLEYAVFIAIVILALVSMSAYITRAISGKIRASGDVFGYGRQYTPPAP